MLPVIPVCLHGKGLLRDVFWGLGFIGFTENDREEEEARGWGPGS